MGNLFFRTSRQEEERRRRERLVPMETPWRRATRKGNLEWSEDEEKGLREECFSPMPSDVTMSINILMIGTSGAGKSAYNNSLISAVSDEITVATFSARKQLTTTNVLHVINLCGVNRLPFNLIDMPGLLEDDNWATLFDELLRLAMKGRVRENVEIFEHNRDRWIAEKPDEAIIPTLAVIVLRTSKPVGGHLLQRINDVTREAGNNRVDVKVILTHADLTSVEEKYPVKNENVKYIFQSHSVLDAVDKASSDTGIPEGQIYPVTNYRYEVATQLEMNILHLYILRCLLRAAVTGARKKQQQATDAVGKQISGTVQSD